MYRKKTVLLSDINGYSTRPVGVAVFLSDGKVTSVRLNVGFARQKGLKTAVLCDGEFCVKDLSALNNFAFNLPDTLCEKAACLVFDARAGNALYFGGNTSGGYKSLLEMAIKKSIDSGESQNEGNRQGVVLSKTVTPQKSKDDTVATVSQIVDYDGFLQKADNYYDGVALDVISAEEISRRAKVSLKEYSDALKDFYDHPSGEGYYDSVKNELQKVFDDYAVYAPLMNEFEESFFVKITDGKGNFFALGLLCDGGRPAYICYALPKNRPTESLCRQLTVTEEGKKVTFCLVLQSAQDGKMRKAAA